MSKYKLLLALVVAAALLIPSLSMARKPKCQWKGGDDPFSEQDMRHVYRSYYMGQLSYLFFPAREDGTVPVEVRVRYGAAIDAPYSKDVQFLLADDTVVKVSPVEPAEGILTATESGVYTTFHIKTTASAEDVRKIYKSGGVKQVRFQFPGNDWDQKFRKADIWHLGELAWCSMHADGDED